jgi:predicted DNA-binding transcriptional regulator YafY
MKAMEKARKKPNRDGSREYLEQLARILELKNIILNGKLSNLDALPQISERYKNVSKSTAKRDLKYLRDELGFIIEHKGGKYVIMRNYDSTAVNIREKFMGLKLLVDDLQLLIQQELDNIMTIDLEHRQYNNPKLKECFYKLAKIAEEQENIVTFKYRPAGNNMELPGKGSKLVRLAPRLLAERNNRLYCIGYNLDKRANITYALDRIDLSSLSEEKIPPAFKKEILELDVAGYFDKIVGISNEEAELLNLELRFTPKQAYYMRKHPFHPKQQVLQDDEENYIIAVELKNTYELRAKILALGEGVEVLKPPAFRAQMAGILQRILEQYSEM